MQTKEDNGAVKTFAKMSLDFTFKRVFANENNKEALLAFLNRVIEGADIVDVDLLPTERLGMISSDRRAVYDIYCRESNGTEYIVKMQNANQKYFRDRAMYYSCFPLIEQGKHGLEEYVKNHESVAGRWDYCLKPVVFIALLNFSMEHSKDWPAEKYNSSYRLLEECTHEVMTDKLRFIFLELGRFRKGLPELDSMHDKWMYALKHMHEFDNIPDELNENEFIDLFNLARITNFTSSEVKSYMEELTMERDYWNTIEYAKEVAGKEAFAEGKAEGRAEGREEELATVIGKLNAKGMSAEEIAGLLDLEPAEVKKILSLQE